MHSGRCLCGAIGYEVNDKLEFVVNCHCEYCRLAHGADYVPVAMITDDKLKITRGSENITRFEVEKVSAFRCFCTHCGTRLFNHSPDFKFISLIIATLDRASDFQAIANVNVRPGNENIAQSRDLPCFPNVPGFDELSNLK